MVEVHTTEQAEQLARDLLNWRLFIVFLELDERGYRFSPGELRRLCDVSRWETKRVRAAVAYFETKLTELK